MCEKNAELLNVIDRFLSLSNIIFNLRNLSKIEILHFVPVMCVTLQDNENEK